MLTWPVTLQCLQKFIIDWTWTLDKETETTEMTAYIVAKKDERALMKDMNVKIRECIMDKNT